MKVVLLNRYFHPDLSATAQLLSDLTKDLVLRGWRVHVITGRQMYEDSKAALARQECVDGVQIHRVWTTTFGRRTLLGRAVDYATFYVTAAVALLGLVRARDIVIATTDPPLIGVVATAVTQVRGAMTINWLQDLFPEVAEKLGLALFKGRLGRFLKYIRNYSLRAAAANVVLGQRMADVVQTLADDARVIHNWPVGPSAPTIRPEDSDFRREWQLGDQFVIAYSGNLGRAHEFETIVQAIEPFRDEDEYCFLFVGGGQHVPSIRRWVQKLDLSSRVRFSPYQPTDRLAHSLAVANVHLVTLQPALEGLIVPSKFYGIAAAARPTLFVGDLDGEIARIIRQFECGYSVEVGNSDALVRYIRLLRNTPELAASLGSNARRAADKFFGRSNAMTKWAALLAEVGARSQKSGSS